MLYIGVLRHSMLCISWNLSSCFRDTMVLSLFLHVGINILLLLQLLQLLFVLMLLRSLVALQLVDRLQALLRVIRHLDLQLLNVSNSSNFSWHTTTERPIFDRAFSRSRACVVRHRFIPDGNGGSNCVGLHEVSATSRSELTDLGCFALTFQCC